MLSSRPASHYHAPHKENLYPSFSSKTPARGLAIHKDGPAAAGGGGARTVGKGAAAKTPFGRAGAGGGKGAMTTGRKGLGASLGPGRVGGQDAEGNIAPLRLFQSSCAGGPSSSTLPHSKSATFAPAAGPTKPSFGDVTNGSSSYHAQQQPFRTPAPPSKRAAAFATPGPGARGVAKQAAVFQTPLPSATRTTRRRSSKLHTPLDQRQRQRTPPPAFSTPMDRTLPADDASFELEQLSAPGGLADLAEAPALAEEAASDELEPEYMPAFSSATYDEPLSLAYDVDDPVALGLAVRAMAVVRPWEDSDERAYAASARRSPEGWEARGGWEMDHFRWTARAGANDNDNDDEGGYDSDEDLAALLNVPLSALKSHQRTTAAKPLTLPVAATSAPSRRPAGGLGASSTTAGPRRAATNVPNTLKAASAVRQQRTTTTTTARDPAAATSTAAARRAPAGLKARTPTTAIAAPAAPAAGAVASRRTALPFATHSTTPRSSALLSRSAALGAPAPSAVAEREAAARADRLAEHRADRAFVLAALDGLPSSAEVDDDASFELDS